MTKLSASLVVDLIDKTGSKTQAIIGNMSRLERAERDFVLADRGLRLSNRDRALERLMVQKEVDLDERRQRIAMWATRGALATAAVGIAAGKAYTDFASLERRVNRIVINADKGAGAIRPTISTLQNVADDTRSSFDSVVEGLETLVASGRTLDESLSFLPSVAMTAQASGAAMADVALSADAMSGSMKIGAEDMQTAFDILVAGGKAGKFELKDMSQYLPSLLPAFSALGYKGTEGLQKIVAMLQMVRNQAGSSGEAATYLGNVLQKVYSVETAKKFSDFGVDLPAALDKAKREGKDVLDVFLDLTEVATKGDLSKLTRLFTDSEMQKGVRALITQRQELEKLNASLKNVDGSALKDFNQIAEDSAAKIERMTGLWNRFTTQVGAGVATVVNPALEAVTNGIEDVGAGLAADEGMDEAQRNEQRQEFERRYRARNPDAWFWEVNNALSEAKKRKGRGETKSVFDELDRQDETERLKKFYSQGYVPGRGDSVGASPATGAIPIPGANPRRDGVSRQELIDAYQYGDGREHTAGAVDEASRWGRKNRREMLRNTPLSKLGMDGQFGAELETGNAPAAPAGDGLQGLIDTMRGWFSSEAQKQVSITGTPTVITQPTGVQSVTVTNPMPAPVVSTVVHVSVTTNATPQAVGQAVGEAIGQKVKAVLSGVHADTEYAVG